MRFQRLRAAAQRFAGHLRLVLGIALAGALAGLLVALVAPVRDAPLLPVTAPALNRALTFAWWATMGWWAGLLAGVAYVFVRGRRR